MRPARIISLLVAVLVMVALWQPALSQAPKVNGLVETVGQGDDAIAVLYTWGTPYEMGYAHAKLLQDGIKSLYKRTMPLFGLGLGGPDKLDEAWKEAEPFVPAGDMEEMRGLVDGSDGLLTLEEVHRLHIAPEVSEWHCSFFAAWGGATADGHLIQIRALDYATEVGLQRVPLITVAFPTGGQPYIVVGWQGFVGCVTGCNESKIAMSEIGDDWDGANDTYAGIPMVFLMKKVVAESTSLDQAVATVQDARRTSSYLYCLGDAKIPSARALQTGHSKCLVYTPEDLPFAQHVPECVYMSMGVDSPWNAKVGGVLAGLAGKISPKHAMEDVMKGCGTGNLHAVCFDLTAGKLWVANAEGDFPNVIDGYTRPFVEFGAAAAYANVREKAGR